MGARVPGTGMSHQHGAGEHIRGGRLEWRCLGRPGRWMWLAAVNGVGLEASPESQRRRHRCSITGDIRHFGHLFDIARGKLSEGKSK